jgi:hypothetical protein
MCPENRTDVGHGGGQCLAGRAIHFEIGVVVDGEVAAEVDDAAWGRLTGDTMYWKWEARVMATRIGANYTGTSCPQNPYDGFLGVNGPPWEKRNLGADSVSSKVR